MTGGNDRRTALRWVAAMALAPTLATRGLAAVPGRGGHFDPPTAPMRFSRRLERSLPDGKKLVVSRGFAVHFDPVADGWTLSGGQIDVAVEAPPWIAAYAALEKQRVETGLFPLRLDGRGLIVGQASAAPSKEVDAAVALAKRGLAAASFSEDERSRLEAFVRAVHEAGAKMSSDLPSDLFAPHDAESRAERALALPGGEQGTIAITFVASSDPTTGVMRSARRDIVTAIAGDRRLTREDWSLLPL